MIKRLLGCVREYKLPSILTLIFIIFEVIIEVFIPFITADLVNSIKAGAEMRELLLTGALLVCMALASLCCGGIAGFTCAKASAGFAKNLRGDLFRKIQTYSFENIDNFSTASLVTRLTTDIGNVQMSYMMLIRTAVRSPLMLIFSSNVMIGRASNDITTAPRMYARTLLKYQHKAAIRQNTAAYSVYLASFSVYFSVSIAKYLCVPWIGTMGLYLCINKQK